MQAENFWQDRVRAEKISRQIASAKKLISSWQELATEHTDLLELTKLTDETDTKAVEELREATQKFELKLKEAELTLFLGGRYDSNGAILTIHCGAGGVDAADWAAMVLRMYLRYSESKGWKATIIDQSVAEEAGIKSATVEIRGDYVYGFLKGEKGGHRLVRRSPFNSIHSRETSFAQVEVLPILEDESEIEINPKDLRVDTFCASGAGGQHVNKTESAVRITHLPTNIVVSCQTERSQQQNRQKALELLRSKLAEKKLEEDKAKENKLRGKAAVADFGGDTIRSYVLDDKRVKDARTGYETHNPEKVLDGELEEFIRAYLMK